MENQNKTIVVREIFSIDNVEASTKYPGKYVADIQFHEAVPACRYWMSEKQKAGLDRCIDQKKRFVAIDATDPAKERFIYASGNRQWLEDTFVPKKTETEVPADIF